MAFDKALVAFSLELSDPHKTLLVVVVPLDDVDKLVECNCNTPYHLLAKETLVQIYSDREQGDEMDQLISAVAENPDRMNLLVVGMPGLKMEELSLVIPLGMFQGMNLH
jgi:hypothetical protein